MHLVGNFYDFRYKEAMSRLKNAAYDPLLSGPERALWWTEYVIRNGGAQFLRSASVGSSFFKYSMLDVLSVLIIITFLFVWTTITVVRYGVKRLRNKALYRQSGEEKFKAL